MFDPAQPLLTQEDHDSYVQWCAAKLVTFTALVEGREAGTAQAPAYGPTMIAASWLWVVAQAQIHLDESVVERRENHQKNLGALFTRARKVERASIGDVSFKELLAARIALDCFEPTGKYADALLTTARMAIEALELICIYPPADKAIIKCAGPWVLVHLGAIMLGEINDESEPLTYADYSVVPSPAMIGKVAWDAATRVSLSAGAQPPSPN